jgi:erythromycin esterase-like protein
MSALRNELSALRNELNELQKQCDAAVEARIKLAKDNLALIERWENVGTTNYMGVTGMTLRDYFAGQAINGIMANGNPHDAVHWVGLAAYSIADEMIEESWESRNKKAAK